MRHFPYSIVPLLLVTFAPSSIGSDVSLVELAKHINSTLSSSQATIRPPLKSQTTVRIHATRAEVDTSPYGSELWADGENVRWVETVNNRPKARVKAGGSPSSHLVDKEESGVVVAGVVTPVASALVRNSRYTFQLERTAHTHGWVTEKANKVGDPEVAAIEKNLSYYLSHASQPARWIITVDGVQDVGVLFETAGFQLTSISRDRSTGHVVVKCTRGYASHPERLIECEYTFDPKCEWLPVKWTESVRSPNFDKAIKCSRTLSLSKGHYESNTEIILSSVAENVTITRQANTTVQTVPAIPDHEFTLAAFQQSESPDLPAAATPLYVWLLAGGLVFLLVSAAAYTLARLRSRRSKSNLDRGGKS